MAARRRLHTAWFSLLLLCFISVGVFRVFRDPAGRPPGLRLQERRLKEFRDGQHVTRALNEVGGAVSDQVLLFNRVPKAGSEMVVLLLQWLQGLNGFRHVRLPGGEKRRLTDEEQEELVRHVTHVARHEAMPVSFDRHVYFLNFSRFDQPAPTYLNLVRDPVDKAVSRFYYGRVTPNPNNPDIRYASPRSTAKPRPVSTGSFEDCVTGGDRECSYLDGHPYDLAIPYFCGHHKRCMLLNDDWALNQAKKNIERFYPVVGVLEELNATLAVLEHRLPVFFKGVQNMYFKELLEPHKNANRRRPRKIDQFIRSHVKRRLVAEYDLYYWLKARVARQARQLVP